MGLFYKIAEYIGLYGKDGAYPFGTIIIYTWRIFPSEITDPASKPYSLSLSFINRSPQYTQPTSGPIVGEIINDSAADTTCNSEELL